MEKCGLNRLSAAHPERQVVFIGDGASDRCAVGRADRLFSVRGSLLQTACIEASAAYTPFDSFAEIVADLNPA